jgi:hypothetical protein
MSSRYVRQRFAFITLLILLSSFLPADSSGAVAQQAPTVPVPSFRSSSVVFIENMGQWDAGARFQVCGGNNTMWLADDPIWFTVIGRSVDHDASSLVDTLIRFHPERANVKHKAAKIRLSFPGTNPVCVFQDKPPYNGAQESASH